MQNRGSAGGMGGGEVKAVTGVGEWAAFARQLERELIRAKHPRLVRSKKVFDFDAALRDVCATEEYLNQEG